MFFYRRIGYVWALIARKLGVTPNAITIASIFLGIGAGVMFYFPNLGLNIIGMLLLVWANSFDSADGQLARMTRQYSRMGRILDGLSGDLWFAAIYIAIALRENATALPFATHPWLIWTLAVAAAICHAKQASMADYYRQFHLYFLKGDNGSELDTAAILRQRLDEIPLRGNFWKRFTHKAYIGYTRGQEATSTAMQALRRELLVRFPSGTVSASFRKAFRKASLPLMKYTNILSFNWRSIALFVSLAVDMPWLYFVFELTVFNAILIYMISRHEAICSQLTRELQLGRYAD